MTNLSKFVLDAFSDFDYEESYGQKHALRRYRRFFLHPIYNLSQHKKIHYTVISNQKQAVEHLQTSIFSVSLFGTFFSKSVVTCNNF